METKKESRSLRPKRDLAKEHEAALQRLTQRWRGSFEPLKLSTATHATVVPPSTSVLVFTSPPGGEIDPKGALLGEPVKTTLGQTATTVLGPSQINALVTTPVQLLPPPGPSSVYIVSEVIVDYKFGTTAYIMATPSIVYGTANTDPQAFTQSVISNIFAGATADKIGANVGQGGFDSDFLSLSQYVNQPVSLANSGPLTQAGDGVVTLTLAYQTYSVA